MEPKRSADGEAAGRHANTLLVTGEREKKRRNGEQSREKMKEKQDSRCRRYEGTRLNERRTERTIKAREKNKCAREEVKRTRRPS